tara:strand:+ start:287 stop:490 length:204 start_codon:yes stop_codon:yes gene_type:complete
MIFASIILTGCASQDNLKYSPTLEKALRKSMGDVVEVCSGRHPQHLECKVMNKRHLERQLSQMLGHF